MSNDWFYILACTAAFLVLDYPFRPKPRLNWRRILWDYIELVQQASREQTLGDPHLRRINGRLHVVGYGQRHRVLSAAEGRRLIARMKRNAEQHLDAQVRENTPVTVG